VTVTPIQIDKPLYWWWELSSPYELGFVTGTAVVHFRGNSGFGGDTLLIPLTWADWTRSDALACAPMASLAAVSAEHTDYGAWAVDNCDWTSQVLSNSTRRILLRAYIAARPAESILLRVAFQANISGVRVRAARKEEDPPVGQMTLPEVLDLPTIEELDLSTVETEVR
jgi:hypothetical protein